MNGAQLPIPGRVVHVPNALIQCGLLFKTGRSRKTTFTPPKVFANAERSRLPRSQMRDRGHPIFLPGPQRRGTRD
jgi:hypothetical protein